MLLNRMFKIASAGTYSSIRIAVAIVIASVQHGKNRRLLGLLLLLLLKGSVEIEQRLLIWLALELW